MKIFPVVWQRRAPSFALSGDTPPPRFTSITIMLTEFCNLDCWMCDFAVSKGQRASLPWTPDDYVRLLRHPYFKQLRAVGFTGGEPFSYAGIQALYAHIQQELPSLFTSFSSNATLIKPMLDTLALTRNWNQTRLFTSIDGVSTHDVQRGTPGALDKSMKHLQILRERFPEMAIQIKFTITPVNAHELKDAYLFCTSKGFDFTAKMLENNPYYTNVLSYEAHKEDFRFNDEQLESVRMQLAWLLNNPAPTLTAQSRHQLQDVLDAIDPTWRRSGRCGVPTQSAFLDARKNFFSCKEYPPLINLDHASLDELTQSPIYRKIVQAEASNEDACTRCTSPLKTARKDMPWARWLSL